MKLQILNGAICLPNGRALISVDAIASETEGDNAETARLIVLAVNAYAPHVLVHCANLQGCIGQATEAAINAGAAVIQRHLGVTAGDFAAQHFDGEAEFTIAKVLADYCACESRDHARQLAEHGYRIKGPGGNPATEPDCGEELAGRYWWTLCRGGDVEVSDGDWAMRSEALADAARAWAAEIADDKGPFYVMIDREQSATECATFEEARAEGRRLAAAEPLPCTFSIANRDGEEIEDIPDRPLSEQVQSFNVNRHARV